MVAPNKRQSFNNGGEGVAVTAGNSATSGDAFATVVVAGAGDGVYAAAAAARGLKGCHVTGGVGDTFTMPLTGGAAASGSGQVYFYVDAAKPPVTGPWTVARLRSASGNVAIAVLTTGRVLQIQNSAGSGLKNLNSNTGLPTGWYVLNLRAAKGTGATDGTIEADLYTADGTPVADGSYAATNVNAGTADITQWQVGKVVTAGEIDAWIDEPAFSTGTLAELDQVPANIDPTVDAGPHQNVTAGATVNLSGSASDTDGTIAAWAWSFLAPASGAPALTGGTTATPSFTAGAAGNLYILQAQATDNSGGAATDTVEVRVPRTGGDPSAPLPANGSGDAWTNTGGAATDGAALADNSDTTYLESPALSASATARRVRLDPSHPRATATAAVRLWTDTGTATTTVRLYEGNTLRQSWTQAITTAPTDYPLTLSPPTIAAIADWGNLWLEVGATT